LVVPRRRAGRLVGLLAAALVVIAGTIGIVHSVSGTRATSVAAVAALHHLDSPTSASGEVTVHATALELRMLVSTKGLPMAPSDHFYEVWLLDPQTNKMLPLGVLSVSGTSTFTISRPLMSQFSAVDISLQDNNGSPQHSTISVLRGTVTAV
jgi:anti-sigma-K factor RskA